MHVVTVSYLACLRQNRSSDSTLNLREYLRKFMRKTAVPRKEFALNLSLFNFWPFYQVNIATKVKAEATPIRIMFENR